MTGRLRFKVCMALVLSVLLLAVLVIGTQRMTVRASDDSGVDGEIAWDITGDTFTISAVPGTTGKMKSEYTFVKDSSGKTTLDTPWSKSSYWDNVKKVIISDGVTEIGSGFLGGLRDPKLDKLEIAGTVKIIPRYVSYGSLDITEIKIHDGVQTIGHNALWGRFDVIHFPDSLISICVDAFGFGDYPFKTVYGTTGSEADRYVQHINNSGAFSSKINFVSTGSSAMPQSFSSGIDSEINWSINGDTLTLSGVSGSQGKMKDHSHNFLINEEFYSPWMRSPNIWDVKNIIIENSVTKLGGEAFSLPSYLSTELRFNKLVIPGSVKAIPDSFIPEAYCFIDEIDIQDGVQSIEACSLACASSVVSIPNSVTSIDIDAFLFIPERYYSYVKKIIGSPGSAAQKFASDFNERINKDVSDYINHLPWNVAEIKLLTDSNGNKYYESDAGIWYYITFIPTDGSAPIPPDIKEPIPTQTNTTNNTSQNTNTTTNNTTQNTNTTSSTQNTTTTQTTSTTSTNGLKSSVVDTRTKKDNANCISFSVENQTKDLFLKVTEATGTSVKNAIAASKIKDLVVYDISLVDSDGNKVTDFKICTITLPLSEYMDPTKGTIYAVSIRNDGSLQMDDVKIVYVNGVRCAQFKATHFSEYGLLYTETPAGQAQQTAAPATTTAASTTTASTGSTTSSSSSSSSGSSSPTPQPPIQITDGQASSAGSAVTNPVQQAPTAPEATTEPDPSTRSNAADMPKTGDFGIYNEIGIVLIMIAAIMMVLMIPTGTNTGTDKGTNKRRYYR